MARSPRPDSPPLPEDALDPVAVMPDDLADEQSAEVEDDGSSMARRVRERTEKLDFSLLMGTDTEQSAVVRFGNTAPPAPPSTSQAIALAPPPTVRGWRLLAILVLVAAVASAVSVFVYHRLAGGQLPGGAAAAAGNPFLKRGLPDPALTPGERADASDTGFFTEQTKRQVFQSYGLDPDDPKYRLIRLIPSELGGSSGPRNLFPNTPWFADLKKRLDQHLVGMVQERKITAKKAELELTDNWIDSMHGHYIRNYGQSDAERAKQMEDQLNW